MIKRLLFSVLFLHSLALIAQTVSCEFNVRISVQDATCFNNGVARFQLLDGSGNSTTASALGLSDARCYYVKEGSTQKYYSDFNVDTLLLEYGSYTLGFEAECWNGSAYVLLDTHTTKTINTSYTPPTASAIFATAENDVGFGRWPTLSCDATGRVQIKIEGGKFPYTVVRKDHNTSEPVDTVIFNTYQYIDPVTSTFLNDRDPSRFDYKDYYTFDNLPAGDWDFYVNDGCGYHLPRTGQIVQTIDNPTLKKVEVARAFSCKDSNVVIVRAFFNNTTLLYQYEPLYRFVNADKGTTAWKPIPKTTSSTVTLYDTVVLANHYCDLFDKNLTIEYRFDRCDVTPDSKTFQISRPTAFYTDYSDYTDSVYSGSENQCVNKWFYHSNYYSIMMQGYNDNAFANLYYTCPLVWVYTDNATNTVIKSDTLTDPHGTSHLWDSDVVGVYGSFQDSPLHLNVNRKLVDAKGCELYSTDDSFTYKYDIGMENSDWRLDRSFDNDNCCSYRRWIKVYEHYKSSASQDGNIVRLVRSPYGNKYNFEAIYSETTRSWRVNKTSLENTATVRGGMDGRSLTIDDYCLPSGPYHFVVITSCDTFYLEENYSFPDRHNVELTEPVSFTRTQVCTDMYLKPISGEISLVKRNTDVNTGLELPPVVTPIPTSFKVISGPIGGYAENSFYIGDSIRISMPGTFVVKFTANNSTMDYCDEIAIYDTVIYEGGTMGYEYGIAILCDAHQSDGDVYVKAKNGTLPHTYTLYSGPDKTGTVIGTNQTGIFENVPFTINDILSCSMQDACGAHFHVNLTPTSLMEAQKTWFDDGSTTQISCQGSVITVHALSTVPIFTYEWSGPNGFYSTSSDPQVFIPRDGGQGWYKVEMTTNNCTGEMQDSIYLRVAPSPTLEIAGDTTVCPGSEAVIRIIPHSPNGAITMNFTLAVDNAEGITYHSYNDVDVDLPQTLTLNVSSFTKVFAEAIYDGVCDYFLADDTIYLNLRTDVANGCTVLTTDTMVCYDSDARLFAKSTMGVPYTLRWYSDYGLTDMLKEENITDNAHWSFYDTAALKQLTTLYVAVQKEGVCPAVNGLPTHQVNMGNSNSTLYCGDVYRLYDSGGENGNYGTGENLKYYFATDNGGRVSIRFEELDLASSSKLYVISGHELHPDSLLYMAESGSTVPEIILSRGDKMTLWFISGSNTPASGWSAIVEHEPGIAIADVWSRNHVTLYDNVCQNQGGQYADPYGAKLWNSITSAAISNNVKTAGTYSYTQTLSGSDMHGCDSTTTLVLSVELPPHADTAVTITNLMGPYFWDKTGEHYSTSGLYSKLYTQSEGCDSLALLYLTILEVDTTTNEICVGDSTMMGIIVTAPEITWDNKLFPNQISLGDLLLDDGSIIKVDSFNAAVHAAPKGIVFYLDSTGMHGWAVALTNASSSCVWSTKAVNTLVHSAMESNLHYDWIRDLGGLNNTLEIKRTAEEASAAGFATNAPAAHNCYFYDHITGSVGSIAKGWYLPSAGQMNLLYANRGYFNKAINSGVLTNAQSIYYSGGFYWTSTGADTNAVYAVVMNVQGDIRYLDKTVIFHVRAICNF